MESSVVAPALAVDVAPVEVVVLAGVQMLVTMTIMSTVDQ
jgi:hypothetical protein